MKLKSIICGVIMTLILAVPVSAAEENDIQIIEQSEVIAQSETIEQEPTVRYRAHVSNIGWMDPVSDGAMAGTTGRNLPMEAIEISLEGSEDLGIEYQVHVSNIGWMDFVSDGAMAGTTGRNLPMEAIRIKLTGEAAEQYDLYYRAHVTNYGWLNWAKNGESSGTEGYACTLQAVEICLVPVGAEPPVSTGYPKAFLAKLSLYHEEYIQRNGWTKKNSVDSIVGTTGKNLNLDGIRLTTNGAEGIGIAYSAHVRNVGWMDYVSNGDTAGIIQDGYTIEAVKMHLTGEYAEQYDLYYRAHIANVGWLDWAKNDEMAGSFGLGYAMQAIEIRVMKKGAGAPGNTGCSYVQNPTTIYTAFVPGTDWQNSVVNGGVAGTTGQNLPMRAFRLDTDMSDVTIKYRAHVSNIGWQDYVTNGAVAGTTNTGNNIEAVQIELAGAKASYYDIWYRVHSANLGWLGWAKNGELAGTASLCYDAQAVQVVIRLKGSPAPGSTERAFVDKLEEEYLWPLPSSTRITSYFGYRNAPTAGASTFHQGIDIGAPSGSVIVATKSGTVTECAYNSIRGYYVEVTHSDGVKSIYMHMSRQAVSTGMKVSRGQTVGYVGSTGVSTGPHLHFSIVVNGKNVNPLNYVNY